MVPGAVGFQCPECVSRGMKQTRQQQLPYGGKRSRDPRLTSFLLIGLNVIVWAGVLATGGAFGGLFDLLSLKAEGYCLASPDRILLVNKSTCLGEGLPWIDGVTSGAWWQLITSAFTHSEVMHIGFNMLALYFLGPGLERVLGRVRFLAIYFTSALSGSAFVMWLTPSHVSTVGASGAIFGLMAAILLVAHKHRGNVRGILMWLGANVVITVMGAAAISWQGHLGGFIGGLATSAIILYLPKDKRSPWQLVLLTAVAVAALGLAALRAILLAGH